MRNQTSTSGSFRRAPVIIDMQVDGVNPSLSGLSGAFSDFFGNMLDSGTALVKDAAGQYVTGAIGTSLEKKKIEAQLKLDLARQAAADKLAGKPVTTTPTKTYVPMVETPWYANPKVMVPVGILTLAGLAYMYKSKKRR